MCESARVTEWHRHIYNDPNIGGTSPKDYFDKHLANVGADNLWVATYKSLVVELVGIIIKENEADVEPLIVKQHHRHRGVGTQLLKTVIAEVQKLAIRFLNVNPVARNIEAIQFFHSHGFTNIGQIQLFMDMTQRPWKTSVKLFNHQFNY